jgi:hypothetical protein
MIPARAAWAAALLIAVAPARAADEISGADKLRVLYSAEFRFTPDGLPVVPVAIAESLAGVTVSASGGLRLLPEGDGGPEVRAPQDEAWQVRAEKTTPAKLRFWSIVWRGGGGQSAPAAEEVRRWKDRGEKARIFEQGTLFGVAGEVLDRRETLVAVGPVASFEEAEKASERLAGRRRVARRHRRVHRARRSAARATRGGGAQVGRARSQRGRALVRRQRGGAAAGGRGRAPVRGHPPPTTEGLRDARSARDARRGEAVPEDRLLAGLVPAEIFPGAPTRRSRRRRWPREASSSQDRHAPRRRSLPPLLADALSGLFRRRPRDPAHHRRRDRHARRGPLHRRRQGPRRHRLLGELRRPHRARRERLARHAALTPRCAATATAPRPTDSFAGGVTTENVARFIAEPPALLVRPRQARRRRALPLDVTRSPADLARLLASYQLGTIKSIDVLERGVSGRARAIKITARPAPRPSAASSASARRCGGCAARVRRRGRRGAATFRGAGFGTA